jgi:uncharacterized protein YceK
MGSGMILDRLGRCRSKSDVLSIMRNRLCPIVLIAISVALLFLSTGCTSLRARKSAWRRGDHSPYIGIRSAVKEFEECANPSFMGKPLPPFGGILFPFYLTPALIIVADMPFSFVLDTVWYPTDKIYGPGHLYAFPRPRRVAVVVKDELGFPITNAYIQTTFKNNGNAGLTGKDGVFVTPNYFGDDVISAEAHHDGYYNSRGDVWIPFGDPKFPPNALAVHMRRMVNPVPMVFHEIRSAIPRMEAPIGFDLQVGAWVEPYGNGRMADLLVTASCSYLKPDRPYRPPKYRVEVDISTPHPQDGFSKYDVRASLDPCMSGIVGTSKSGPPWDRREITGWMSSCFRAPHVAPADGYTNTLKLFLRNDTFTSSFQKMTGWGFRVRSETNELGHVTDAHVGWTDEDFQVYYDEKKGSAEISFKYYYNPDPASRSLEPKVVADQQAKSIPGKAK